MPGTATLEDVARSVHQVADAVSDMSRDRIDRQTVERIAEEVMTRSRSHRRGFNPSDLDGRKLSG